MHDKENIDTSVSGSPNQAEGDGRPRRRAADKGGALTAGLFETQAGLLSSQASDSQVIEGMMFQVTGSTEMAEGMKSNSRQGKRRRTSFDMAHERADEGSKADVDVDWCSGSAAKALLASGYAQGVADTIRHFEGTIDDFGAQLEKLAVQVTLQEDAWQPSVASLRHDLNAVRAAFRRCADDVAGPSTTMDVHEDNSGPLSMSYEKHDVNPSQSAYLNLMCNI